VTAELLYLSVATPLLVALVHQARRLGLAVRGRRHSWSASGRGRGGRRGGSPPTGRAVVSSDAGWCAGYPNRPPHFVDLLIRTNAPAPLCQVCHLAWLRDDRGHHD
jgi:hypothetical protein